MITVNRSTGKPVALFRGAWIASIIDALASMGGCGTVRDVAAYILGDNVSGTLTRQVAMRMSRLARDGYLIRKGYGVYCINERIILHG